MPSPDAFRWLLRKEWRELLVSRSWWLLLLVMAPLTGVSFIGAVHTYAEVSGLNGTSAGVGEALDPLTGVWAPAFSGCELAAVFLLPFVAIRIVAADRQSGALKLELQRSVSLAAPTLAPSSPDRKGGGQAQGARDPLPYSRGLNSALPALTRTSIARIAAKALVALAGWLIAMLPPLSAILLWKTYGGSTYAPELATLIGGHILNATMTIALGAAAASLTEHPSTAAIVTLGVTVGTWIVNFFAAIQGGFWERLASYTPAAMVAGFQHGLVQLDTVLIAIVLTLTGLGVAAIWQRLGIRESRRTAESIALLLLSAAIILACTAFAHASWDNSESRGNSFPLSGERALRQQIRDPLKIVVHLAPEDPRRADLEHRALSKLRRVLPTNLLDIQYVSATRIGMFEQTNAGYGEIHYSMKGRTEVSRITTAEGVLESIYSVADITLLEDSIGDEPVFRGHPLAVPPKGAAAIFYFLWPGAILLAGFLVHRKFQ